MFRTIGYKWGVLLWAKFTLDFINALTGALTKVASLAILILLFAIISKVFLGKVSVLYRRVLFILPIKLFESLQGACITMLSSRNIAYLI